MKYEVVTDGFEVEKLAEDIYLSGDKPFVYIDYADLRTLRRISTLKYGISFKISCSNNKFIEEILYVIKSQDISLCNLKTYLINIRINENETSLNYENIGNLLEQIRVLKPTDSSEDYFKGLWTLNTNSSIPLGECYINLIFGFNKTVEDQREDEKHEQMIEEYHKIKLPPVEWDFSELKSLPRPCRHWLTGRYISFR